MTSAAGTTVQDLGAALDRALERYLDEDAVSAMHICGGVLERDGKNAAAWFIVGLCASALREGDAAALAFHTAFHLARGAGQLGLAAAATLELAQYGDDTHQRLGRLAEYYLGGTGTAQPPAPLVPGGPIAPWNASMSLPVVIGRLEPLSRVDLPGWSTSAALRPAPRMPWSALGARGLAALLNCFGVAFARAATTLVQEDSAGTEVFVIAWGAATVHRRLPRGEMHAIAALASGDIFGEMALLTRTARSASVTTERVSVMLIATACGLDTVAEHYPTVGHGLVVHCRQRMLRNLFHASSVLGCVAQADRSTLLASFETVAFDVGATLEEPGKTPQGLHVIAVGKVRLSERHGSPDPPAPVELGIGEVVGETAIVLRRPATSLVTALIPTVTLWLPRNRFLSVMERHPLLLRELYRIALARTEGDSGITEQSGCSARDIVFV